MLLSVPFSQWEIESDFKDQLFFLFPDTFVRWNLNCQEQHVMMMIPVRADSNDSLVSTWCLESLYYIWEQAHHQKQMARC